MDSEVRRYFGVNTSLYNTLRPNQIEALERAIYSTTIGDYATAHSIFGGELSRLKNIPVVAIERAELALQQGRYKEIWTTLDYALTDVPSEQSGQGDASRRLMSMFRALAALKYKGILEPAKEELRRVREWLADTPVSDYTDVQVNTIRKYALASLYVTLYSDNDEYETSLVPKPGNSMTPWQGLTDLRVSLLNRDMVFEALALFKAERNRIPHSDRLSAVSSFISSLASCGRMDAVQTLLVNAELHFQYALTHNDLGDVVYAEEQLRMMDNVLDVWCAIAKFSPKAALALHLSNQWLRLTLMDSDNQLAIYQRSTELLQDMETRGHLRTASCFAIASKAARELSLSQDNPGLYQSFLNLHRRLEIYEEKILGDLPELIIDFSYMLTNAMRNYVDLRKVLEWINGFLDEYPSFQIPTSLHSLHNLRLLALTMLGEGQEEMDRSRRAMKSLEKSLPSRYGPLVGVRPVDISTNAHADLQRASGDNSCGKMDLLDLEEDNFWVEWSDSHLDAAKQFQKAMQLLSRCMAQDLQDGVISPHGVLDVFGIPENMRKSDANKSISEELGSFTALTDDNLFCGLYSQLPDKPSLVPQETSQREDVRQESTQQESFPPVSVKSWDVRYAALTRWLNTRSKSTISGRQSLLLVLQDIRIHTLRSYKYPKDLCSRISNYTDTITECKRAIGMMTELRQPVQEYFSEHLLDWHSLIANMCIELCYESEDLLTNESLKYPEKAHEHATRVITGNVRRNNTVLAAFAQRDMAQIYLLQLRRAVIQQASLDFRAKLRDAGLEFLSKADKCFDQVELASSWSDGPEALQSRRYITLSHVNWLSTEVAVHLLIEGNPNPDDATRTSMWEWVQKSKSQALASTMGMNRTDPPSMRRKVDESEVCSKLYRKMHELRNAISLADPRDRYPLRIKLDDHINNMREHGLLRKILDTREGKPLTTRDLDEIVDGTDRQVVFVDWFYLPGLHAAGRILMFTAAIGSTPTVDTLTTTPDEVRSWIDNYLDRPRTQSDHIWPPLRDSRIRNVCTSRLSSLVEPLSRRSKRGDILLLCPTSILHRIPLHALDIRDVEHGKETSGALIRRNPIAYSHSHSILRLCFWASKSAAESRQLINPFFMDGVSYSEGVRLHNFNDGFAAIRDLNSQFSCAPALHAPNATKSAFISALKTTRLAHIHTHCNWDKESPLEHCIEFPKPPPPLPPPTSTSTSEDAAINSNSLKLTAREIFSLRGGVQIGSHINLLVCSGGLSRIARGDEPLGLISALLYSGAASTVSTLWPTLDQDAAAFGKAFFREFRAQCKSLEFDGGEGKWIDLTRVVQKAVVSMDPGQTAELVKWAPFMLYGYWKVWIDGEEGRDYVARAHGKGERREEEADKK